MQTKFKIGIFNGGWESTWEEIVNWYASKEGGGKGLGEDVSTSPLLIGTRWRAAERDATGDCEGDWEGRVACVRRIGRVERKVAKERESTKKNREGRELGIFKKY